MSNSQDNFKGTPPDFTILPLVQVKVDGSPINLEEIQEICSDGLDVCPPEDRVIAWLVLSRVYPLQPEEWKELREKRKNLYLEYIDLFGLKDYENRIYSNTTEQTQFDLSNNPLMELIHGDVIRTSHHIQFLPYPDPDAPEPEFPEDCLMPYHNQIRRLERLLYIFANLNPTISYLQGFNELSIVIYYAYSSAMDYFNNDFLLMEAFVFFTFQQLLASTKLNELFTTHDKSFMIHNRMNQFMEILKLHLPKSYHIITELDIHPLYFCFRWLNLLFAQDYLMPNLLLIWDSLMAHFHELVDYANYVAVAHVKMIENQLDIDDYNKTITALQKIQIEDIKTLLKWTKKYWNDDHNGKSDTTNAMLNAFQSLKEKLSIHPFKKKE